jgi:hypothetical protein
MLKRILLVLFVLAQGALFSAAWGEDRDAEVKELMSALQFEARLEASHQDALKMLDSQTARMIAQIKRAAPNLDEEAMTELNAAAQTFAQRVMKSWDPAEASRVYGGALVDGLSEKELKATIAHYRTPEGQRELTVIFAASRAMNAYILQSIQKAMEGASDEYVAQVRAIMTHQRERWRAPAPAAIKK